MWPTIPGGLGEMWYISETNKISLFSGLKISISGWSRDYTKG